jgi:hypothetical protein
MLRTVSMTLIVAVALAGSGSAGAPAADSPQTAEPVEHRALLDRYCVTCQNQRARTADLAFDTMTLADVASDPEI